MSEWLMAATFFCAVLAAVFAGLSWRAQRRRGGDGAESDRRIQERLGELGDELKDNRDKVVEMSTTVRRMDGQMGRLSDEVKTSAENIRKSTEERLDSMRNDTKQSLKDSRESGEQSMHNLRESVDAKLTETANKVGEMRDKTAESLDAVRKDTEGNLGKLRESVENRLDGMGRRINDELKETRESGEKKLDEIRATVDEKLQTTLEKRLVEQFGIVGSQLEKVHKGLGEMQALSSQVGNLQRVLTSARARGQWGEVVLKDLIRQILTSDQYQENVEFDGGERVEFAIRIPVEGGLALLPVDSKFPMDNYEQLVDAEEKGEDSSAYRKALLNSIRNSARDIRVKYIHPPSSTDYAFLFLPTEGLYAVAASERGFLDEIQRVHKVRVTGPDNFAPFLSAVRMGFQLFAAGRRANEIQEILGAVKNEFGKFGEVLRLVRKNLEAAANNIDRTETRVSVMTKKLREVEALSDEDAAGILDSNPSPENNGND